jgi:trans-aconitate methyltransferase
LIDLLDPQPNEHVLDLGCGTGELSQAIAEKGAVVTGIDADPQMISQAETQFPSVMFSVADARSFLLPTQVDAVFSNAALHWVPESERAVASIANVLKPGGRFVAEFGGNGNIGAITKYLDAATSPTRNPWYFPSISQYSSLLEKHGLEVTFAQLYDRPTPLNEGDDGLRNWILMFGGTYLEGLSDWEKEELLRGAEVTLRPTLHNGEQWVADYRRIRLVAKRVANGNEQMSDKVCDNL